MATTYLQRAETDPQGSTVSRQKVTMSMWIKRDVLGGEDCFYSHYYDASNYLHMRFNSDNTLQMEEHVGGSNTILLTTDRVFRDVSGWYHFCFECDSTQSVSTDRIKIYVNGVQETSFSSTTYPTQDDPFLVDGGSGYYTYIGQRGAGSLYFTGLMTYYIYVNGTAYPASTFGEVDSDTGEWKILTSPTVTYGDKGFFILKNGNSVTDQSGEGNNFTVGGGTLTNTEDCPDDVFATWNPLANQTVAGGTFTTGNNTWQSGNTYYSYMPSTIGVTKGKFYWEVKVSAMTGATEWHLLGISSSQPTALTSYLGELQYDYSYYGQNGYKYTNNTGIGPWGDTYGVGDIVSVALDIDNLKVYFAKNGTWQDSGDPTSGATGTGAAYTIEDPANTAQGCYFPSACYYDNSTNGTYQANFGNGYFGTTIISSEGTNASGIGKFEYDVPAGFTALSTKGLNS